MISLVETGLMNALLAVGLALPILILGRIWHRPALVHAFWILVLIKLVSPPLYQVNLPWQMPAWPMTEVAETTTHSLPTLAAVNGAAGLAVDSQSVPLSEPGSTRNLLFGNVAETAWQGFGIAVVFLQGIMAPAIFLWMIGSACWFAWQGWRVVRFAQVFLRSAQLAPESLQQQARVLALQMGMKHAPAVWLLPAVVSPMLWSVGGKARILFPGELLSRLDDYAVATLLTHELAHYRRGDHRVRILEFLASGLFWWHPLIWVARREMEISEEQCCDAWVVSQFPASQRRYADALLATVDFLSEDHPPVPALASGLGDVPMLRQRLKLIMCGTAPKSLSALGRLAVILTAMLIPISPSLRTPSPEVVPIARAIAPEPAPAVEQRNMKAVQSRAARLIEELDALSEAVRASQARRPANLPPFAVGMPGNLSAATAPAWRSTTIQFKKLDQAANVGLPQGNTPWACQDTSLRQSPSIMAWTISNGVAGPGISVDETIRRNASVPLAILFSPDCHRLWAACREGVVRTWDASDYQLLLQWRDRSGNVQAIALAPRRNCAGVGTDRPRVVMQWRFNTRSPAKSSIKLPAEVL